MHSGERWRLGHRPALDGLRGIAVLLVMASHAVPQPFDAAGSVGVTVFFVLSGFLITALLLEEHQHHGRVSFAAFYARRARRLLPALLAMVTAVAVVATVVPGFVDVAMIVAALCYFANLVASVHGATALGALGHTWSLSMEEQFYLLWPLLVVASIRFGRRTVGALAGVGVVGSAGFRVLASEHGASHDLVHFSPFAHADGLLLGCLLAVVMPVVNRRRLPVAPAALLVGALLGWCAADGWWRLVVAPFAVAVLTVWLIVTVVGRPGWVAAAWLRWCGRRSYALYLWHFPVVFFVNTVTPGRAWALALVGFTVPFALAELSWRFVETPFLSDGAQPRGSIADPSCQPEESQAIGGTEVPSHHPEVVVSTETSAVPSQ